MNVGNPITTGMAFRMANIMTELWCFTTNIALQL